MKQLGILWCVCLLMLSTYAPAQLIKNQCFYAQKKGFRNVTSILILPLKDSIYIVEYFHSGNGVDELQQTDTLVYKNYQFMNERCVVSIDNNRLVIANKEEKEEYKFQIRTLCDATINELRNKPYRNALFLKITNPMNAKKFKEATEQSLTILCHESFIQFANNQFEEWNK